MPASRNQPVLDILHFINMYYVYYLRQGTHVYAGAYVRLSARLSACIKQKTAWPILPELIGGLKHGPRNIKFWIIASKLHLLALVLEVGALRVPGCQQDYKN